jgi:exonuclease III
MDNRLTSINRDWKILCWNIRGLNSAAKWLSLRDKIKESFCDVICLEETKREFLEQAYIKNFCQPAFVCFDYVPSEGHC